MVILRDGPAVPPEGNPRAQAVIEKRTFGLEKDKTAVLRYSQTYQIGFYLFSNFIGLQPAVRIKRKRSFSVNFELFLYFSSFFSSTFF
jgi:hypothetical protein